MENAAAGGYDPVRAFLNGYCSVLGGGVAREVGSNLLGWPRRTEVSERAMAKFMQEMKAEPSEELLKKHERLLEEARAEDWRRLRHAVRLSYMGQATSFFQAVALICATVALALKGHEGLATGAVAVLLIEMICSQIWLARQRSPMVEPHGKA